MTRLGLLACAAAAAALLGVAPAQAALISIAPAAFNQTAVFTFEGPAEFGRVNPSYGYPGGIASFGGSFSGQALSGVSIVDFDFNTVSNVLVGAQDDPVNGTTPDYTGSVAVQFSLPVNQVALSVNYDSFPQSLPFQAVTLEAFRADGTSLGLVTVAGATAIERLFLADSMGAAIAGLSIRASDTTVFTILSIDNVAVSVAVPEPASIALVAGMVLLGLTIRRRA